MVRVAPFFDSRFTTYRQRVFSQYLLVLCTEGWYMSVNCKSICIGSASGFRSSFTYILRVFAVSVKPEVVIS